MSEFSGAKKLRRTRRGRILAGVCSGVGEYFGIDANIIRIALAVASFFGGMGVAIYAVGWLLLPDEDKDTSILQDLIDKQRSQSSWTPAEPREVGDYPQSQPYDTQSRPYDDPLSSEPVDAPPTRTPGGEPKP